MNAEMRIDYAIYCSEAKYENRELYKFYSIKNRDLIAYKTKIATHYDVSDSVYETHKACLEKCVYASHRNRRMFVKVEIDDDEVTWVREVYNTDQILELITGEQFQGLIEQYYKHWDVLREKRQLLEKVEKQIAELEEERKVLQGWIPIGLYDADDRLYPDMENEDSDVEEA